LAEQLSESRMSPWHASAKARALCSEDSGLLKVGVGTGHRSDLACQLQFERREMKPVTFKIRHVEDYFCPHCGVSLRGDPIPRKSQHVFGCDHFGREIGIYDIASDRTVMWKCPDCGSMWPRKA